MALSPELLRKAQALMLARRSQAQTVPDVPPVANPIAGVADAARQFAAQLSKSATYGSLDPAAITLQSGKRITYNERQQLAIQYALEGKSFCLIGAAGTGKTTGLNGALGALLSSGIIPALSESTKHLHKGQPGVVCISYTRRAVRQMAKNVPKNVPTLTGHKLLEFEPVYYEIERPDGTLAKTMRFEPQRSNARPLPSDIRTIIIDEASMFSIDLYDLLLDAIHHGIQIILLGDLHQLPPVYGQSVLAAKLTEWPVVELTEVYRQALESPIIQLATAIKDGRGWPVTAKTTISSPDGKSTVTINPWKSELRGCDDGAPSTLPTALDGFKGFCDAMIRADEFDEEEDIILMPYNKACGTLELNKHIANTLGKKRGAIVWHVIAGYENHYLAVGDRVLYEKQDCVIIDIAPNPTYTGKQTNEPGKSLTRWGHYEDDAERKHNSAYEDARSINVETILAQMSMVGEDDDKFNQASHIIQLVSVELYEDWKQQGEIAVKPFSVKETGAINQMLFAYALTVHKSQGSEWRRVFLFLHRSHHAMCSRELIYTAITRAREELYIICEPDRPRRPGTLTKAAQSPRIIGDTLEAKIKWLQNKQAANELIKEMA